MYRCILCDYEVKQGKPTEVDEGLMCGDGMGCRRRALAKMIFLTKDINPESRHPLSTRFHELLAEAGALHDRKQSDYGRNNDPFANVRVTSEWGIPAWVGAMIRLNDKVVRLKSLALKGSLNNEAAEDSFMDISVYALIARILFEENNNG